jgi:hypothetical protein
MGFSSFAEVVDRDGGGEFPSIGDGAPGRGRWGGSAESIRSAS